MIDGLYPNLEGVQGLRSPPLRASPTSTRFSLLNTEIRGRLPVDLLQV